MQARVWSLARRGKRDCVLVFLAVFYAGVATPCAVAEFFAIVVLIEGEAGAARGDPNKCYHNEDIDEGVAWDFELLCVCWIIADLQASRIVAIDWHQDHERRLQERRHNDGQNNPEHLHPELIVFET